MAELVHDFKGSVRDSGAETGPVDLRELLVSLVEAWRPAGMTRGMVFFFEVPLGR